MKIVKHQKEFGNLSPNTDCYLQAHPSKTTFTSCGVFLTFFCRTFLVRLTILMSGLILEAKQMLS